MKIFIKAILTTTAFAFVLGVSAASLSTAAHAYAVCCWSASDANRCMAPNLYDPWRVVCAV